MIRVLFVGDVPAVALSGPADEGSPRNIAISYEKTGSAALDLIRQSRPDLVISAASLADMTGTDLAREVNQAFFEVPVIVVSDGIALPDALIGWITENACSQQVKGAESGETRGDLPDGSVGGYGPAIEALVASNRILNKSNSEVRHTILNHLTVLLGYLELFPSVPGKTETEYIGKIGNAASAIYDCMILTRAYQGIGLSPPCWHDLQTIIRVAASDSEVYLSELPGNLPSVYGDTLIGKAFFRIFSLIAAFKGGPVKVELAGTGPAGDAVVRIQTITGIDRGEKRYDIFGCRAVEPAGTTAFPAREILAVTGIGIQESGDHGSLRIEIRFPGDRYRPGPR